MNTSMEDLDSTGTTVVVALARSEYLQAVTALRESFDRWDPAIFDDFCARILIPRFGGGEVDEWHSVANAVGVEDSLFNLAVLFWNNTGREFEAIQIMRQSFAAGGEGARTALADWLIWFGASDEAVQLLGGWVQEHPEGERARALYGRALLDSGALIDDEVVGWLRESVAHDREFSEDLVAALTRRGQYQEARVFLDAEVEEGSAGAALKLGNLLADHLNEPELAELAYRRAIDLGDANAAHNLGLHLAARGRRGEAVAYLELAVQRGDLDATADLEDLRKYGKLS